MQAQCKNNLFTVAVSRHFLILVHVLQMEGAANRPSHPQPFRNISTMQKQRITGCRKLRCSDLCPCFANGGFHPQTACYFLMQARCKNNNSNLSSVAARSFLSILAKAGSRFRPPQTLLPFRNASTCKTQPMKECPKRCAAIFVHAL